MLAFVLSPSIIAAQNSLAQKGILNLHHWDFKDQGSATLNGEWEFYMSALIAPESFNDSLHTPNDYIDFPGTWNELSKSLHPGDGYATYRLKVLIDAPQTFCLELPHFYSSYNLWINSELVASNGKVGTSFKNTIPQWLPQTVKYSAKSETLDVVIQVANFHHALGGVRKPIVLGPAEGLMFKREVSLTSNVALFVSLIITGIFFLLLIISKKEKSIVYFSLLCITWAFRSVFSNLYVVTVFFPDFPWELCVKMEYTSLYLTMIWAILFLARLFPSDVNNLFKYFLVVCNLIFIGFTVFTKASLYTQFLPVYLSFCFILLVYVIYVLIRAVVYEREGVWLIISCIMLGVILFSYDLISYEGFASFNAIIINVGYLLMFLLMGTCLSYQLGFIKKSNRGGNMLTYEDLYGSQRK
jgi:hypothetical protein